MLMKKKVEIQNKIFQKKHKQIKMKNQTKKIKIKKTKNEVQYGVTLIQLSCKRNVFSEECKWLNQNLMHNMIENI